MPKNRRDFLKQAAGDDALSRARERRDAPRCCSARPAGMRDLTGHWKKVSLFRARGMNILNEGRLSGAKMDRRGKRESRSLPDEG